MLSAFTKFRKSKERKQAEILINKGLSLIQSNFQHKALYQFQQALDVSPETVAEMLSGEFDKCVKRGDNELALSIGLIVLKIKSDDFELANKLGNCARKLKKYKQANDLYRQAFRINRNYEIALYNLAASMGRIPKYNSDIKLLIDQFNNVKGYILPNYKLSPDYLEQISNEIVESRETEMERETETKSSLTPSYPELRRAISRKIKALEPHITKPEKKGLYEKHLFNLGLLALSNQDSHFALKCFFNLKKRKSRLKHLDMCITLAMDLESPTKKVVQHLMVLLGKDKTNRYLNANLGIMFRKRGKKILSYKYLATTALLLEKTGGIYCRWHLVEMADREMELGNLKKALGLYQQVDAEINDIHVKSGIGQILLYQNRYLDALPFYKQIIDLDKTNKDATNKLKEIHNYFQEKGDELVEIDKLTTALPFYENALKASRVPETVKKLADVYKHLMNPDKAEALYIEYNQLKRELGKTDKEAQRQQMIDDGKDHLAKKEYEKAIDLFEKAFTMKVDKDVFVFLAHIYKILKRTDDLKQLMARWKEMIHTQGIKLDEI